MLDDGDNVLGALEISFGIKHIYNGSNNAFRLLVANEELSRVPYGLSDLGKKEIVTA